jgi:mediator of replication checkpoint protein 1
MSDSEDEAEMRRRKKQREFDQMFRALKQDEVVGKMAENPKRKAFFATIMDHSDDSDLEFLDHPEEAAANAASQSDEEKQDKQETQEMSIPDSQTTDVPSNPLKRKSPAADFREKENRPPPHLRRTAAADAMTRRPISAADIKDSVAELLDEPRDVVPESQYISLSDSEDESSATVIRQERVVKNRLSRTPSLATEASTTSNMAFQAPSAASAGGFRVPSLIRRATSNLSVASERSTSSTGRSSEGGVRMGGTGRSNIHAQAREAERRALLDKVDGKRKEALKKKVGLARGKRSVLSNLGGGFE